MEAPPTISPAVAHGPRGIVGEVSGCASTMTTAAMAIFLLAGACGPSGGSATTAAPADLTVALAGLCRAAEHARSEDLFEARRTFQNQSHAFLHELAAMGSGEARAAVARLLEAKQRVEMALGPGGSATPAEVGKLIGELEAATRDLAGQLGTPAPRCGGAGG
jgi:hypothetical protein